MIIDVQDLILNRVLNSCLYIILVLGLISLIPWRLKSGKNRWTMVLPVLAILLYVVYEYAMPDNWDIRMDLILLWPVLIVIILASAVRGALIWYFSTHSR